MQWLSIKHTSLSKLENLDKGVTFNSGILDSREPGLLLKVRICEMILCGLKRKALDLSGTKRLLGHEERPR